MRALIAGLALIALSVPAQAGHYYWNGAHWRYVSNSYHHHHHQQRHHYSYRRQRPRKMDAVQPVARARAATTTPIAALEDLPQGAPYPLPSQRPYRLAGQLTVGMLRFPFASGGSGRGSIPFGSWLITPDELGSWGRRHGAIGLNHDEIPDPQVGERGGIEIHPAGWFRSAGCVVLLPKDFVEVRQAIDQMIRTFGQAYLHISLNAAAITPSPFMPVLAPTIEPPVALAYERGRRQRFATYRPRVRYAHRHHARYAHVRHHRVRYAGG